jgi:hypothetical protein
MKSTRIIVSPAVPKTVSPYEKYTGKRFKCEEQLFETIMKLHDNPGIVAGVLFMNGCLGSRDDRMFTTESHIGGVNVHAMGEPRFSKWTLEHARENFARLIMENPKDWIFILEQDSAFTIKDKSDLNTYLLGRGYYVELAHMNGIPIIPAISDIYDPKVRSAIVREGPRPKSYVDTAVFLLAGESPDLVELLPAPGKETLAPTSDANTGGADVDFLKAVAMKMRISVQYAATLYGNFNLMKSLGILIPTMERINHAWNRVSSARVEAALGKIEGRTEALAVVDAPHIRVFTRVEA